MNLAFPIPPNHPSSGPQKWQGGKYDFDIPTENSGQDHHPKQQPNARNSQIGQDFAWRFLEKGDQKEDLTHQRQNCQGMDDVGWIGNEFGKQLCFSLKQKGMLPLSPFQVSEKGENDQEEIGEFWVHFKFPFPFYHNQFTRIFLTFSYPRLAYSSFPPWRNSCGALPLIFLKARLKVAFELKPESKASDKRV